MVYDKIKQNYKAIADAYRAKTKTSAKMTAEEIVEKVSEMVAIDSEGVLTYRGDNSPKMEVQLSNTSTWGLSIHKVKFNTIVSPAGIEYIIPKEVHYINDSSFKNVSSTTGFQNWPVATPRTLKKIIIPADIEELGIGIYAFEHTSMIGNMIFPGDSRTVYCDWYMPNISDFNRIGASAEYIPNYRMLKADGTPWTLAELEADWDYSIHKDEPGLQQSAYYGYAHLPVRTIINDDFTYNYYSPFTFTSSDPFKIYFEPNMTETGYYIMRDAVRQWNTFTEPTYLYFVDETNVSDIIDAIYLEVVTKQPASKQSVRANIREFLSHWTTASDQTMFFWNGTEYVNLSSYADFQSVLTAYEALPDTASSSSNNSGYYSY